MVVFLSVVIVLLLVVSFYQYNAKLQRNKELRYINKKLDEIMKNKTSEKVLMFTDDKELIPFLIQINKLLEYNQKILAKYSKLEISMRKMLSNISHDLKTPLTVVIGYIETMELHNHFKNEKDKEYILEIKNKTNEVMGLINKFFDLAKLESGDKEVPLTKINMNEILRENILKFYDVITGKGIEVNIDIPEENIYVLGNSDAIYRILNNLISNAIKYGSDGNVIGLSLKYDEKFSYVSVWDKGKGINEIDKDRVFERMYTLDDSRNKLNRGSGLGLTITKRLVEKLKGEIYLSSVPYEKTTFTFKLKRITY